MTYYIGARVECDNCGFDTPLHMSGSGVEQHSDHFRIDFETLEEKVAEIDWHVLPDRRIICDLCFSNLHHKENSDANTHSL